MNYRKSYYLTHPWEIIKECVESVHCFYLRGRYGYSYKDVWSLDSYLSSWLPKALRELKKCGNSYPANSDYPQVYPVFKKENDLPKKGMTPKKWHAILEQMARGFEEINIKGTRDFPNRWLKEDRKRRKQRDLFSFWFWNLWD